MNYQQEIQNCSKQYSVAVSSVGCNPGLNFRHMCGEKSFLSSPFAFGSLRFARSCASPQNLNAYEKKLRKMNLIDPKKEQLKLVQSLVFRVQSKYAYRAFFSMLLAPCPSLFALLLHPNDIKTSKMKNLITKQFKTNT